MSRSGRFGDEGGTGRIRSHPERDGIPLLPVPWHRVCSPSSSTAIHGIKLQALLDAHQRLEVAIVMQQGHAVLDGNAGDETVMRAAWGDAFSAASDIELRCCRVGFDGMGGHEKRQAAEVVLQLRELLR